MKFEKVNPDLIDMAQSWISSNPAEAAIAATVILLSVTLKLRHAF